MVTRPFDRLTRQISDTQSSSGTDYQTGAVWGWMFVSYASLSKHLGTGMSTPGNEDDPSTAEDRFGRQDARSSSVLSTAVVIAFIIVVVLAVYFLKHGR